MEPLIRAGDWVEVRPREPARRGSVVLARSGSGELVCHRLLARGDHVLCLAGDRSLAAEVHCRDSVLGVVRGVTRDGSRQRLGGWWNRGADRLQAALHRLSLRLRHRLPGRGLEALRRMLLELRGRLLWLAAG